MDNLTGVLAYIDILREIIIVINDMILRINELVSITINYYLLPLRGL